MVADKQIPLLRLQPFKAVRPPQIRQGEKNVRTHTEQRLDEHQTLRDLVMVGLVHPEIVGQAQRKDAAAQRGSTQSFSGRMVIP